MYSSTIKSANLNKESAEKSKNLESQKVRWKRCGHTKHARHHDRPDEVRFASESVREWCEEERADGGAQDHHHVRVRCLDLPGAHQIILLKQQRTII